MSIESGKAAIAALYAELALQLSEMPRGDRVQMLSQCADSAFGDCVETGMSPEQASRFVASMLTQLHIHMLRQLSRPNANDAPRSADFHPPGLT